MTLAVVKQDQEINVENLAVHCSLCETQDWINRITNPLTGNQSMYMYFNCAFSRSPGVLL